MLLSRIATDAASEANAAIGELTLHDTPAELNAVYVETYVQSTCTEYRTNIHTAFPDYACVCCVICSQYCITLMLRTVLLQMLR